MQYYFNGTIDEVRLWNTALSQSTIQSWMHREVTSSHPNYSNLVSYWKLNDGSGTTATDSKGSNNGTLTNGPTWVTSTAPLGDKSQVGTGTSNLTENSDVPVDISWDSDPGTDAIFAAIQVDQSPDVTTGLLSNYPSTYWELWIANDDGSFQADVTFHFDNINGIGDEANLKLYTRSSAGQSWSEVSSYTINNEGNNTDGTGSITANNLTSFSQFIITSSEADNSLPVRLTSFTARQEGSAVVLEWVTESEIENLGFILERRDSKLEIRNWEEIASYITDSRLQGQGSVTYGTEYRFVDSTVVVGKTYEYQIADVSYSGEVRYHALTTLTVEEFEPVPDRFTVYQNYPNPFNAQTTISYYLPHESYVTVSIYDLIGRKLKTLVRGKQVGGRHELKWDGSNAANGIYIYRIETAYGIVSKKLVILK